jgi:hypothetical protein
MKKIIVMSIIVVFLVLFFKGYSYFVGFKEWTKQTWADFGILSILNTLGIFVFIIFGLLALLKHISPKFFYRYFTDKMQNLDLHYVICFCIILTLIIPLIIFNVSFAWFIRQCSIITFIYLFSVASVCIKIFKI